MKKKRFIQVGLAAPAGVFLIFSVFILIKPQYNCNNTPGAHYCHLGNDQPRLIERISSSFPEDWQVKLGGFILNTRQDLISKDENLKATELASQIYNEMSQTENWANLPPSLGISYERILRLNYKQSQYFTYIPKNKPQRVLVFLHGFGGNFTSYLYLLSKVAEDTNSILISPSYKQGVWDEASIEFIDSVITEVLLSTDLNNMPITLVGLSNGGLIIPEYVQKSKYNFDSVVALSTYLDSSKYTNVDLHNKLKNAKFTYIYGSIDTRLGLDDSFKSVEFLRNKGVIVDTIEVEGSHLIFFEEKDKVLNSIKNTILSPDTSI